MSELLNIAIKAAKEAGKEILKHYDDYKIYTKEDNSPLTTADIASNKIIFEILSKSNIPICSEEKILDYSIRKSSKYFWLVDPLDGTKEFIHKNGEFCVCIALIEDGHPILSVINIPIKDETFYSEKGSLIYKNGAPLNNITRKNDDLITGHGNYRPKIETLSKILDCEILRVGSAIKFPFLIEQKAGIYVRLINSYLWDIAAGHFLLTQSGGSIIDLTTLKPPKYNEERLLNNPFLATNKQNTDKIKYLLKSINNIKF